MSYLAQAVVSAADIDSFILQIGAGNEMSE